MLVLCFLEALLAMQIVFPRMKLICLTSIMLAAEALRFAPRAPHLVRLGAVVGDGGKFEKMDDILKKPQTPLPACVLIANANNAMSEYHFETLDDIISALSLEVPVVILGAEHARVTPRSLLLPATSGKFLALDHVLPKVAMARDAPCCMLFSGLPRDAMRAIIFGIKQWDSPDNGKFPPTAFAMVVENALDTPLAALFEDISRDWKENEN